EKSGEVHLWDVAAGKERAVLRGHHDIVRVLAFSPDGKALASGTGLPSNPEGEVLLWDVPRAAPGVPLAGSVTGNVTSLAFSPDGRTLAAGSLGSNFSDWQGEAKLWGLPSGQERLHLKGYANIIWGVAFSPDGQTLASANADRTVKLWDVSPGPE